MKILIIFALFITFCVTNEINLQEFTTGNRKFTAELYKNIAKTTDNFLLSPLSVETVLAVAQSGAKNETGEEIRKVLHLPNSIEKVESIFQHLIPKLKGRKSYSLLNATKIYIKNNYPIKTEFVEIARKIYNCPIENVDFTRKNHVVKTINNWVERKTNNKIHNLIDVQSLSDATAVILINAIYFKAEWLKTFKHYSTKKEIFFTIGGETMEVEMMHSRQDYEYYENEVLDAKFLKLGFKDCKRAHMIIILPNKQDGLMEVEKYVDKVLITPKFKRQHVDLALPKFKIETKINFSEILKSMGVDKAFGDNADFSGIAGEKGQLKISDILQKTFIDVRENGVEATAATSVQFSSRSFIQQMGERKKFIVDHPFLFYIKIKHVIVFAGRVLVPST